jgi:DNA processing protein
MSDAIDLIALSFLPVLSWPAVAVLLRAGVTPSAVLESQCDQRCARDPRAASAARLRHRATTAIARGEASGLSLLTLTGDGYPPLLSVIVDPPPVLWCRGDPAHLQKTSVAIVGARSGSPYAQSVAEQLAHDLVARGLVVTSGLARGVDAAAHRGALAGRGTTVAVLGCGADVVYPAEHATLAADIASSGTVVSEFAPATRPRPEFFPRRNRLISGLSRAVVVIEAGEKSGSLITARCALDQGRDVLAVPGTVLSGRSKGSNALIRDGARLVETAEDVLEELGLRDPRNARMHQQTTEHPECAIAACTELHEPDPVLRALADGEIRDLDQISAASGLTAPAILARLCELELAGQVRRLPGGQFVRTGRSC